ncbi:hypothetical protein [Amycolatopsis vancoresmycina]|uniref:DUF4190 domain-containing protein n=1 Tax=Amycolatopsis vancoresmycina DSM 44592 TaxID=1292037 RepID=R1FUQ6_9PSEU|nr:hypothetical protein [Amycolatopsis vancoresmycina]EOD63142.1 hypothetical protein H480_38570 [Amycolatopsis vancoresmycina DSM 44592]
MTPQSPNFGYPAPWDAPAERPKGPWLAVAAVVLGGLGCVVPLLPIDLTGVRAFVAFPFALPGLVSGVLGCVGRRQAKALAVVGVVLSGLALLLGVIMVAGFVLR